MSPALRGGFLLPPALFAEYQAIVLFLFSGRSGMWFAWTFTSGLSRRLDWPYLAAIGSLVLLGMSGRWMAGPAQRWRPT